MFNLNKMFGKKDNKPIEYKIGTNSREKYFENVMPRFEKALLDPFVQERMLDKMLSTSTEPNLKDMTAEEAHEFCIRAWHDCKVLNSVAGYFADSMGAVVDKINQSTALDMPGSSFQNPLYIYDDAFNAEKIEHELKAHHEIVPMPDRVELPSLGNDETPQIMLALLKLQILKFQRAIDNVAATRIVLRGFNNK